MIVDLIRAKIEAMIDVAKWRKEAAEQHNRELLDRVSRIDPRSRGALGLSRSGTGGRSPIVFQHGARLVHPQPLCRASGSGAIA